MEIKEAIIYGICALLLILTVSFGVLSLKYSSPDEVAVLVDDVTTTVSNDYEARLNTAQVDADAQLAEVVAQNEAALAESVAQNEAAQAEAAGLQAILTAIEQEKVTAEAKAENEYLKDELKLGEVVTITVSDRDLNNLYDGEVRFDGSNYDAEEVLELVNAEVAINQNDFADNVYLVLEEGAIVYSYVIEDSLDTSEIDTDDSLVFNFLGEEVEITSWDGDEVNIFKGEYNFMKETTTISVGTDLIALEIVNDDYVYVKVASNGKSFSSKIYEGETEEIGGYEIWAKEVLDNEEGEDWATLVVGEDVSYEVEDGDEYEEDSIWDWKITDNTIGLVLNEDFDELDEDFNALSAGDSICLPNNYACVRFDGVSEEDEEDYIFELDNDYDVEASGNFLSGINDYDRVYIDATGIYDEDDELIDVSEILLDNTDLTLYVDASGTVTIGDVEFNFALTELTVDGKDLSDNEDDYLSTYGTVIKDPEDNLEDNEVRLTVPEEALEASIAFVGTA